MELSAGYGMPRNLIRSPEPSTLNTRMQDSRMQFACYFSLSYSKCIGFSVMGSGKIKAKKKFGEIKKSFFFPALLSGTILF